MHKTELSELKANLARARKLVINSPKHLREEREAEVERLERAMKRTESIVNREKREHAEQSALEKIKKEEKEKREHGKKGWWLKDCEYYFLRRNIGTPPLTSLLSFQLRRKKSAPAPASTQSRKKVVREQ